MSKWQDFRPSGDLPWEQNYRFLAAIDPHLAVAYAVRPPQYTENKWKRDLDAFCGVDTFSGNSVANQLIGQVIEPGPGSVEFPRFQIDRDGQTIRVGVQPRRRKDVDTRAVYVMPAVDPKFKRA